MAFRLIPREEKFYTDFNAMATDVVLGAQLLQEMFAGDKPLHDKAQQIREAEHRCDFLTHEIIQRLNRTFVTPIDREDIAALARVLDDIMDAIDGAAALVPLYRIETILPEARDLTKIITQQVEKIRLAFIALEKHKGVLELAAEVDALEGEADRVHGHAVSKLFDNERDPILLIKWKELLDLLEGATDRCQDVANLLESVVVKHG